MNANDRDNLAACALVVVLLRLRDECAAKSDTVEQDTVKRNRPKQIRLTDCPLDRLGSWNLNLLSNLSSDYNSRPRRSPVRRQDSRWR